jgi:hypothetical protein
MKRWQVLLASLAALLLIVITPLTIMAQTPTTPTPTPQLKGALAIVAPWIIKPGESMQLTVFLRKDQSTMAGANVWAVPKDKVEAVKQAVKELRQKSGANATDADYQGVLNNNGNSLGQTDGSGKLIYTFNNSGIFWLVAFKAGYAPGFARLVVQEIPQALAIKAPGTAAPGTTVIFTVDLKGTTTPVSDAAVWAITADNAAALEAKVAEVKAANQGSLQNVDWESVLNNVAATKFNRTDASGKTSGSFGNSGIYLVIALKKGYVPAYHFLSVFATAAQPSPAATLAPGTTTR